jgi:hypothetical protein
MLIWQFSFQNNFLQLTDLSFNMGSQVRSRPISTGFNNFRHYITCINLGKTLAQPTFWCHYNTENEKERTTELQLPTQHDANTK